MRPVFCLLTLLTLPSCSLLDPDFPGGKSRDGGGGAVEMPVLPADSAGRGQLWLSAVEYPAGYDWKRDTARGQVTCRLVLFCDGKRVVEIPVNPGGVTPEPDMHRIVEGHLYTDYVTEGGETVIGCDGRECFRYSGRESLRGFLCEDAVYTLGQNRDGPGFSCRKEGVEVYAGDEGAVVGSYGPGARRSGALYRDGTSLCFAWYTNVQKRRCWIWRDGDIRELPLPEDATIFDIRSVRGRDVMAYGRKGQLVMVFGEDPPRALLNTTVAHCRILPGGTDPDWGFSLLVHIRHGPAEYDLLIRPDGTRSLCMGLNHITEYQLLSAGDASVMLNAAGKVARIRWMDLSDDTPALRERILMGPQCVFFTDQQALVALTGDPGLGGSAPAIWNRGELRTLLLSGYLTGIAYE